jgi:hypothetical protein
VNARWDNTPYSATLNQPNLGWSMIEQWERDNQECTSVIIKNTIATFWFRGIWRLVQLQIGHQKAQELPGKEYEKWYLIHYPSMCQIYGRSKSRTLTRYLGQYLKVTCKIGTILWPVEGKDLEVYVDAGFCGNWDPKETWVVDTARSWHGYIISYAGCPVMWTSQLQTEIALSSTESEYCGLSYALRDAIPIMELLKEMKCFKFPIRTARVKVHCQVFEDNSGALENCKLSTNSDRKQNISTWNIISFEIIGRSLPY